MIGASYIQSTTSSIGGGDYTAVIVPPSITTQTTNGSYTTPLLTVGVYNGIGPYEYEWIDADMFGIFSDDYGRQTTFSVSGYNENKTVVLNCRVTDTGNSNEVTFATTYLDVTYS